MTTTRPTDLARACRSTASVREAPKLGGWQESSPGPKAWRHPKVVSEHAFDQLQLLGCAFGEFDAAIVDAEVIEDRPLDARAR